MKFKVMRGGEGRRARVFLEDGTELMGLHKLEASSEPEVVSLAHHAIDDPSGGAKFEWAITSLRMEFLYPEVEFISEAPAK